MDMETEELSIFPCLPPEIIEKIFLSSTVQDKELCYLSRTCSAFRDVLLVNKLWESKFFQRWPELQLQLETLTLTKETHLCWRSIYCDRILLKKDTAEKLREFSNKTHRGQDKALLIMDEGDFYDFGSLSIFSEHRKRHLDHEQKMALIISELLEVYHSGDQNLNAKYFAEKSLSYLRHLQFESEIKTYISMPTEKRDIEEGAVLIAKWFQPTLSFSLDDIKAKLDKLASRVRTTLFDMHSNHPIFTSTFKMPNLFELKESLWNVHDCRLIISAIEQTLKPLLRKDTNTHQYYVTENSFINLVLDFHRGIPITLSLLTSAVARRLGLVLEPVNFPRHFILRWMERPTHSGIDRFTFIDVFNGNYSLTYSNLVENFQMPDFSISIQDCDSCTSNDILQRMLKNLVALGRHSHLGVDMILLHHACQLYILFFPYDRHMHMFGIQIQLHLGINLPKAICNIEELASASPWNHTHLTHLESKCKYAMEQAKHCEDKIELKKRSSYKEVKFSVGMVMWHKKHDYLCVIYGWDNVCKAGRDWIIQMGVNRRQEQEPFYNVLVMDGTHRYSCQENLQFTLDACEITHPMVGLYFDSFNGKYYTPCECVQKQYPEDGNVTQHDITMFFDSQSKPE